MIWVIGLILIAALSLLVNPLVRMYKWNFTYRDPSLEEIHWSSVWRRMHDLSD